jgi:probable rRNA maturation factor
MKGYCEITEKTKGKLPRLPFVTIKNAILGNEYELSIVSISQNESHKLNKKYRGKDKSTNILSFPLTKESGEIFLDLIQIRKDLPNFDMNYTTFVKFLFIHGCLHLKGMQHGSTMEKEEKKFLKRF